MSVHTTRENKSSEGAGIAFIIFLVMAVPMFLWNGFVLKTVWNWFIPEIFQGTPTLNIAQAIGLGLVISIFTYRRVATSSKEETALEGVTAGIIGELLAGGLVLIVGLIVHGFI